MGILEIKAEDFSDTENIILTLETDDTVVVSLTDIIQSALENHGHNSDLAHNIYAILREMN